MSQGQVVSKEEGKKKFDWTGRPSLHAHDLVDVRVDPRDAGGEVGFGEASNDCHSSRPE